MGLDDDSLEKIGHEDLTLPKATLDKIIHEALISGLQKFKKPSRVHEDVNATLKTSSKDIENDEIKEEVKTKKRKYKRKSKKTGINNDLDDNNIRTDDKNIKLDDVCTSTSEKRTTVSKEVKELIMKSAIEFIHLITAEANEICEKENKRTITHDHILESLKSLGYESYIDYCVEAYEDHMKINQLKPGKSNIFETCGLSMEVLYQQQKKLFEDAKQAFNPINEECAKDLKEEKEIDDK